MRAAIDLIEEEHLLDNCATVGGYFREQLEGLQQKHALIGEVCSMGLMQGPNWFATAKRKSPRRRKPINCWNGRGNQPPGNSI